MVSVFTFHPILVILAICALYIVLMSALEELSVILLTVPLFFPIVTTLGFDAILFGVLVVRMTEIALITPPVGMNVYVLSGIAKYVSLDKIFKGALPFVVADVLHVAMLVAFPILVLWLPNL